MNVKNKKSVALIVAHPDDETLWAGGTILSHPSWNCFVVCLCRKSDDERAVKFQKALEALGAEGIMGDMDDGPSQEPLDEDEVERLIIELLPHRHFNLIITHNPTGEYKRHLRHEQTSKAVIRLWFTGKISASELWTFAYKEEGTEKYPKPIKTAPYYKTLTKRIQEKKLKIITLIYGFEENSFEAESNPKAEAFWQFINSYDAKRWLANGGIIHESISII